jgi:iron only hydrogenase large subunit-like protein
MSDAFDSTRHVVFTNKARCRDCYRCVRVCPVKAIRMHEGQAYVVAERCIGCGTCVRECPQEAKSYRWDLGRAKELFQPDTQVAVSVAPSFAAAYPPSLRRRLPSALRRLGFAYVGETAIGAFHVAKATADIVAANPNDSHICTACPAVVRYVELYRPELIEKLAPIVSPMIAHALHIRDRLHDQGQVRVVFVGPCVAKKAEAERPEHEGLVNVAITFHELDEWLRQEQIDLAACEESDFDEEPLGHAKLFPLEGGSIRTSGWSTDVLAANMISASGFEELSSAFDDMATSEIPHIVEPLFCPQGCVNGPAMPGGRNLFLCRRDVLDYAGPEKVPAAVESNDPRLKTTFSATPTDSFHDITEEQIRRELQASGKGRQEDQLNCCACGYASCRDKAIAVILGMAEREMCIPRMKRLAEQRADRIIETSPNGIVILDEHLRILNMNAAFQRFFMCTESVCGQPIGYLMDPEPFERLAFGQESLVEITVDHKKYGIVCHQILYPLIEEKQFVGIFVNITNNRANQQKLDHLRAQTLVQARELLEHQIEMAQRMAQFLGENTAKGEDLVEKLVVLANEEGDAEENEGSRQSVSQWIKQTYHRGK